MPQKRLFDEAELEAAATRSDSADEDYDEQASRAVGRKPSRRHQKKHAKKRARRSRRSGDDSDDLSEDLGEDSFVEDSIEELEVDPVTGRGRRSTRTRGPQYVEPSTDEDLDPDEADDDDEADKEGQPDSDNDKGSGGKAEAVTPMKKSLTVTLHVNQPRMTRASSAKLSSRHTSVEPLSSGTRRSGRLRHDDRPETSGRSRTTTPEIPKRSTTSRKGLKKPETSTILEDSQESSGRNQSADPRPLSKHGSTANPDESEDIEIPVEPKTDTQMATLGEDDATADVQPVPANDDDNDDDDDDDEPVRGRGRATRATRSSGNADSDRTSTKKRKRDEDGSDFEYGVEDEGDEMSDSEAARGSSSKGNGDDDDDDQEEENSSTNARKSDRLSKGKAKSTSRRVSLSADEEEELAEELEELTQGRRKRRAAMMANEPLLRDRRQRKQVDYRVYKPDLLQPPEDDQEPAPSPSRRARGGGGAGWQRSLFPTFGPFGGAGGPPPVFGGPGAIGAAGGVDSDSSDDERMQRSNNFNVGMTPTSGAPPGLLPPAQAHGADPLQAGGLAGTPANLGKIKDRQALADADPLGVDQNVTFDSVGGLGDHINQLQEMVALPLLYPEVFSRFHVTPPRGVLFHGPPGTGKTLLARALATSVSSHGRKVTFYMRKGADALSKWVGEAERQLRLLFEEARKNQPSIIFFDEIDGLAPVRSSKQEQIHASIVSTLLALMDGMDGRGQVIVIGATNRPDSVDPALRRPGRFDREFYFPLPSTAARRSILDIHTKGWQPGLSDAFKDELAEVTKGYGGADLRALCTEAALNAVQRRYPQIYKSNEKLVIDPTTINVAAKDFMISIKKLVPSSERSASSGAAPLPKVIEPLLRNSLSQITEILRDIMPQARKTTALEEAEFEDSNDSNGGFIREKLQQDFERSRIFRPRLLVRGREGMGQQYLAAAVLNHFEGYHVQSFDLPTLLSDSTRTPEAAVVQLFTEVKRHKPSVIYLPNVNTWYNTVGPVVVSTLRGLLRSVPPTDPILVLGMLEGEPEDIDSTMVRDLFGVAKKSQLQLFRPDEPSRAEFFSPIIGHIKREPDEFPDPTNRKKRVLEQLKVAPAPPPKPPSKEELQAEKKRDRQILNMLKIRIQPIMDQIKIKYRIFRVPPVDPSQLRYLQEEENVNVVASDIPKAMFRPYEKATDKDGNPGLLEVANNKFYYNMDIITIEERLSNGYYCRPKDFFRDVSFLAKDARTLEDRNRAIKANELVANVDVDIAMVEAEAVFADLDGLYVREMKRRRDLDKKAQKRLASKEAGEHAQVEARSRALALEQAPEAAPREETTADSITLNDPIRPATPSRQSHQSSLSNGYHSSMSHFAEAGSSIGLSNGSSIPSQGGIDVQMTDANQPLHQTTTAGGQHLWGLPPREHSRAVSASNTQRSQKSGLTAMPAGSQVEEFVNDASTTTSDKKTSESNRSSGPAWGTQGSNGILARDVNSSGEIALPDTQEGPPSSQSSGNAASQPIPVSQLPAVSSIFNNLGTAKIGGASSRTSVPIDAVQANPNALSTFGREMASRTSGCSIEQLEFINARLMDAVWKTRGDWNRNNVLLLCVDVLEECVDELGNEVGEGSQGRTKERVVRALERG